jgi:hypothetical protein
MVIMEGSKKNQAGNSSCDFPIGRRDDEIIADSVDQESTDLTLAAYREDFGWRFA